MTADEGEKICTVVGAIGAVVVAATADSMSRDIPSILCTMIYSVFDLCLFLSPSIPPIVCRVN